MGDLVLIYASLPRPISYTTFTISSLPNYPSYLLLAIDDQLDVDGVDFIQQDPTILELNKGPSRLLMVLADLDGQLQVARRDGRSWSGKAFFQLWGRA